MTTSAMRVAIKGDQADSTPLKRIITIVGWSILILFALIETLPFAFTVANSFKCLPAAAGEPQSLIPIFPFGIACRDSEGNPLTASETSATWTFNPALEGYDEILNDFPMPRWALNSFIYAAAITMLHLLFDSLAGYALARLQFRGNRLIFFIILGTMMIPGIVLIIPRFLILKQLGLLNSYFGIIIPAAVDAFGIFLMKQFFESIPGEIEEAAQVDGANRFVLFFRIVLPMATPALTALAIFSFQGTWNNFLDVLIVNPNNQNLWNLPVGLALLRGQFGGELRWHTFLAGAVITTVPLAVVFFTFQRYFVEGISYSGLKG